MQLLTTFLPWVIPFAPGCSEPMAVQALRDAAIEFCEESQLIQQWLDPITLVEGQSVYDLDAPSQQKVAMILAATIDRTPISKMPAIFVSAQAGDNGTPQGAYTTAPDSVLQLALEAPPDAAAAGRTLAVKAALAPSITATAVDDQLHADWLRGLADGALSILLDIPNQPFTDAPRAANKRVEFALAKAKAKREATRGRIAADLRVTPRPFA